jgi:hypothetical protein
MPTILVTLPGGLSSDGVQLAIPVEPDLADHIDVLVRPAHSAQRWERGSVLGVTVEIR